MAEGSPERLTALESPAPNEPVPPVPARSGPRPPVGIWVLGSLPARSSWLRVALGCALIFSLSAMPDVRPPLDLETFKGMADFLFRKACHLTEYFFLMVWALRAVESTAPRARRWHFLLAFLFAVGYAATDEWHQTFVLGRTGTVRDVFIDSLGALAGGLWLARLGRQAGEPRP